MEIDPRIREIVVVEAGRRLRLRRGHQIQRLPLRRRKMRSGLDGALTIVIEYPPAECAERIRSLVRRQHSVSLVVDLGENGPCVLPEPAPIHVASEEDTGYHQGEEMFG